MKKWFLLFLLIPIVQNVSFNATTDYCKILNCFEKHIACKNNGELSPDCPPNVQLVDFKALKTQILALYNGVRNKVAGGLLGDFYYGLRMAEMQWSDELAYLAELNVKLCVNRRDRCRSTKAFPNAGQNNAYHIWKDNSTNNFEKLVKKSISNWLNEYTYSDIFILRKYPIVEPRPLQHHFAIAVNEKNTHIGCAAMYFYKNSYNRFILTCNFATRNFPNKPVYQYQDEPKHIAKLCKTGRSSTYAYLCSPNEVYIFKRMYIKRL